MIKEKPYLVRRGHLRTHVMCTQNWTLGLYLDLIGIWEFDLSLTTTLYFKLENLNHWYNNMGSWLDLDICAGTWLCETWSAYGNPHTGMACHQSEHACGSSEILDFQTPCHIHCTDTVCPGYVSACDTWGFLLWKISWNTTHTQRAFLLCAFGGGWSAFLQNQTLCCSQRRCTRTTSPRAHLPNMGGRTFLIRKAPEEPEGGTDATQVHNRSWIKS